MRSFHRSDDYGVVSRRGHARRPSTLRGSMRLGGLFAVLLGVNIYIFFFRGGTSIHDIMKTSAIGKKAALAAQSDRAGAGKDKEDKATKSDDSMVVQGTMKGHLGLSSALAASKMDSTQVSELIAALGPELNLRALRPDHTFEARLDPRDGRLRSFVYRTSPVNAVEVTRSSSGGLHAKKRDMALTTKQVRVAGRIESSLDAAMSRAGESSALVAMFVDLFSWDVNWYADPRDGDEVRVVVEKQYLGDKFLRYGRILAAEYRGKVGRFQAFHFKPTGAAAGYFIPEGRSLRRDFLKTPLHFRRMSSKYNLRRLHPVLHTTRGHFGVDYAAATGTPIWAASDGKVALVGKSGGGGNMIVLNHAGSVSTMYMHLSRFARGLKAGQKVKQRQVIGYVGCTGLCTGPHLHYGIKAGGRYIDPMKFNTRKGELLGRADRIRFLDQLPARLAELEKIPLATTPAPAAAAAQGAASAEAAGVPPAAGD